MLHTSLEVLSIGFIVIISVHVYALLGRRTVSWRWTWSKQCVHVWLLRPRMENCHTGLTWSRSGEYWRNLVDVSRKLLIVPVGHEVCSITPLYCNLRMARLRTLFKGRFVNLQVSKLAYNFWALHTSVNW